MTTAPTQAPSSEELNSGRKRSAAASPRAWILAALSVSTLVAIAWNARNYPDERVGNPEVTGAPRPVGPLWGFDHWLTVLQVFTVLAMLAIIVACVWGWRRYGPHPLLLMTIACTFIVWQDPIANWAVYAVYTPKLWHWPESWPLVSLAPTVEPFVVIGYAIWILAPYFPAIWILRRIQARQPTDSFVWRHPLVCLGVLIVLIGFIWDAILEVTLIWTGMYIYSQVIPFGSILAGTPHQFPLIWESLGVALVMVPAGILIYRDDTGRTVAEKLARRVRLFPNRPVLGSFLVIVAIINVAYLTYIAEFTLIRWSGAATSVACPYPYPDTKVYDPQGYYEKNGQQGPFSAGTWSGWMSLQPNGRPHVEAPAGDGRCGPNSHE